MKKYKHTWGLPRFLRASLLISFLIFCLSDERNIKYSKLIIVKIEKKKEPSETDYVPQTGLFLGSEGRWKMGGHRRGGWGETDYLIFVPSAKLHLPMLSRNVTT